MNDYKKILLNLTEAKGKDLWSEDSEDNEMLLDSIGNWKNAAQLAKMKYNQLPSDVKKAVDEEASNFPEACTEEINPGQTVHTPAGPAKVQAIKGSKVIVTLIDGNKVPQEYDITDVKAESVATKSFNTYKDWKYTIQIDSDVSENEFVYQITSPDKKVTVFCYEPEVTEQGATKKVKQLIDDITFSPGVLLKLTSPNYQISGDKVAFVKGCKEDWDMSNGSAFTTTKFLKDKKEELPAEDAMKKGFEAEKKEHPELSDNEVMQLVRDHLSEDPNYYAKEEMLKESVQSDGKAMADKIDALTHQLFTLRMSNQDLVKKLGARDAFKDAEEYLDNLSSIVSDRAKSYQESYKDALKELTEESRAITVDGFLSPEPGPDATEHEIQILGHAYASCRKGGGDKESCSSVAWGAVNKYRDKK